MRYAVSGLQKTRIPTRFALPEVPEVLEARKREHEYFIPQISRQNGHSGVCPPGLANHWPLLCTDIWNPEIRQFILQANCEPQQKEVAVTVIHPSNFSADGSPV